MQHPTPFTSQGRESLRPYLLSDLVTLWRRLVLMLLCKCFSQLFKVLTSGLHGSFASLLQGQGYRGYTRYNATSMHEASVQQMSKPLAGTNSPALFSNCALYNAITYILRSLTDVICTSPSDFPKQLMPQKWPQLQIVHCKLNSLNLHICAIMMHLSLSVDLFVWKVNLGLPNEAYSSWWWLFLFCFGYILCD